MTSHVRIGDNRIFTLKQAVLLYQEGSTTFATLHEVKSLPEGAPYLGAGQSVTTGFLEALAKYASSQTDREPALTSSGTRMLPRQTRPCASVFQ